MLTLQIRKSERERGYVICVRLHNWLVKGRARVRKYVFWCLAKFVLCFSLGKKSDTSTHVKNLGYSTFSTAGAQWHTKKISVMLWIYPYMVIGRPLGTDVALATCFSLRSPQLWHPWPNNFLTSQGLRCSLQRTLWKPTAEARAVSTHCIINHVCFLLHCFIWFSSKSKRRQRITNPKLLVLFISKPEPALCGQVYFKEIPESPLLLWLSENRVPTLSSKNYR